MSPFNLRFANFWEECVLGRVEMCWEHAGRKDAGSVLEAVGVGMVLWPDDGVEGQEQRDSQHHFQTAPHLKQSQLKSMQHVDFYLSAPVPTLFSFKLLYLCPLANMYLDTVFCSTHMCYVQFLVFLWKTISISYCVRKTSAEGEMTLFCAEITICFSSSGKYMVLKPGVYSQNLFQIKVYHKG